MAQPSRKPALITEDLMIPSDTAGIALHLRNKRSATVGRPSANRTILMLHGATYPSECYFDVPHGGFSFMDYLALRGYDVYAVDVRGYGGSTRPPEMDMPADDNAPLVRTDTAMRDSLPQLTSS